MPAVFEQPHETSLQCDLVPLGEDVHGARVLHGLIRELGATFVERVEPGRVNRPRDALAAGAAEIARHAIQHRPPARGGRLGLPQWKQEAEGGAHSGDVAAASGTGRIGASVGASDIGRIYGVPGVRSIDAPPRFDPRQSPIDFGQRARDHAGGQ